jgi:hypothetical protein
VFGEQLLDHIKGIIDDHLDVVLLGIVFQVLPGSFLWYLEGIAGPVFVLVLQHIADLGFIPGEVFRFRVME